MQREEFAASSGMGSHRHLKGQEDFRPRNQENSKVFLFVLDPCLAPSGIASCGEYG